MRDNDYRRCEAAEPDDCGAGLRNRYFRRKGMGAEEFRIEQRYFIERRRLLSRTIVGEGVAYGFVLSQEKKSRAPLEVSAGFALDCHGAEIVNAVRRQIEPSDAVILSTNSNNCMSIAAEQKFTSGQWLLSVHYAERDLDRVSLTTGCDCSSEEFRYLCETLVFSLRSLGECDCPCGERPCRSCGCAAAACGDGGRIARRCQCESSKDAPGCGPSPGRQKACEWRGLHFDPDAGVPLACVTIEVDPLRSCNPAAFDAISDACGPRRLIKTNERLYDLIRGCDLTYIERIGWQEFHRSDVKWRLFERMFKPPAKALAADGAGRERSRGEKRSEPCPTEFTVHFSKAVQRSTLKPEAFVFVGITQERGTGWLDVRRVPLYGIDSEPEGPPDDGGAWPPELTNRARIVVDLGWFKEEVSDEADASWFEHEPTAIEIEIRGDLILDCNGIAVDANARGTAGVPTGNGTPGGTFVSAFTVAKKTWERIES